MIRKWTPFTDGVSVLLCSRIWLVSSWKTFLVQSLFFPRRGILLSTSPYMYYMLSFSCTHLVGDSQHIWQWSLWIGCVYRFLGNAFEGFSGWIPTIYLLQGHLCLSSFVLPLCNVCAMNFEAPHICVCVSICIYVCTYLYRQEYIYKIFKNISNI